MGITGWLAVCAAAAAAFPFAASGKPAGGAEPASPRPPVFDFPVRGPALADRAGLHGEDARAKALERLRGLHRTKGVPVVWCTIPSAAEAAGEKGRGLTAHALARELFIRGVIEEAAQGMDREAAPAAAGDTLRPPGAERREGLDAGTENSWARRGILVLVAPNEQKVAVECGTEWLPRTDDLARLRRVIGTYLDRGQNDEALLRGVEALETFAAGRRVALPGETLQVFYSACALVLVILGIVSYLRSGRESVAYKTSSAVLSFAGLAISFALRRGAALAAGPAGETGAGGGEAGRLAWGRW